METKDSGVDSFFVKTFLSKHEGDETDGPPIHQEDSWVSVLKWMKGFGKYQGPGKGTGEGLALHQLHV